MKKLISAMLAFCLLFSFTGCADSEPTPEDGGISILCTTYPVYLFTKAVLADVPDIEPELLVDQSISCIHDYSLSVTDMKKIEKADVVIISGAGFEIFLDDIDLSGKTVIDSSENIALLQNSEGTDPHIWLDPERAGQMAVNIAKGLNALDSVTFFSCPTAGEAYCQELAAFKSELKAQLDGISCRKLITFHDGFGYFAEAMELDILKAIEEEAGSEASAAEVTEIVSLIDQYSIPAIFTEVNGSDSTAMAISRETGVTVSTLNMIISGDGLENSADPYKAAMTANVTAIAEAMK